MKDKVELRIAFMPKHRDVTFWVPLDLSVSQAASLISSLLAKEEPALWEPTGEEDLILCDSLDSSDGNLLNPNESVRALCLQGVLANGTRLALV